MGFFSKDRVLIILMCLLLFGGIVLSVEAERKSKEEIYEQKLSKLKDDDVKGYYQLARWCKRYKLTAQAKALFQKVLELDPDHSNARRNLGYIKYKGKWIKQEDKSKVDYEEKLTQLTEEDVKGHYKLGEWCKRKGLLDEAKTQFERVIKLDPDHTKARKKLGYIKYKDQWVTKEEKEAIIAKKKGLVKYGNKWIKPREMESQRAKERASLGWDFEYKIQSNHFLIYASTKEEEAKYVSNVLECFYQTYTKCFGEYFKIPTEHRPFKMKLFKSEAEFHQKVPEAGSLGVGYYDPNIRFSQSIYDRELAQKKKWPPYSNSLHEVTHQLENELLNANFPMWLSEGLASYFESSQVRNNRLICGEIDPGSTPGSYLFRTKWGPGDIKKYLSMSREAWRSEQDPDLNQIQYFNCWMLTHFLFHYQDGIYRESFLKYIERAKRGSVNLETFETLIDKVDTIHTRLVDYVKSLRTKDK